MGYEFDSQKMYVQAHFSQLFLLHIANINKIKAKLLSTLYTF